MAVSIGDILIAQNLITRTQLLEAMDYNQMHPNDTLQEIIVRRGLCTREALTQAVARYNDFATAHPDPEESVSMLEKVAEKSAQRTVELDATVTALLADD